MSLGVSQGIALLPWGTSLRSGGMLASACWHDWQTQAVTNSSDEKGVCEGFDAVRASGDQECPSLWSTAALDSLRCVWVLVAELAGTMFVDGHPPCTLAFAQGWVGAVGLEGVWRWGSSWVWHGIGVKADVQAAETLDCECRLLGEPFTAVRSKAAKSEDSGQERCVAAVCRGS